MLRLLEKCLRRSFRVSSLFAADAECVYCIGRSLRLCLVNATTASDVPASAAIDAITTVFGDVAVVMKSLLLLPSGMAARAIGSVEYWATANRCCMAASHLASRCSWSSRLPISLLTSMAGCAGDRKKERNNKKGTRTTDITAVTGDGCSTAARWKKEKTKTKDTVDYSMTESNIGTLPV